MTFISWAIIIVIVQTKREKMKLNNTKIIIIIIRSCGDNRILYLQNEFAFDYSDFNQFKHRLIEKPKLDLDKRNLKR